MPVGFLGSIVVPVVGLLMILAAALVFALSPHEALFFAGLGCVLLGIGGVAKVSLPGAVVVGSAGLVLMVVGSVVP